MKVTLRDVFQRVIRSPVKIPDPKVDTLSTSSARQTEWGGLRTAKRLHQDKE